MQGYLGEFPVDVKDTEYANYTPADWALFCVERYGQFDGGHHKQWALDQIARVLNGTPMVITEARWDNGHTELRISTDEPSQGYLDWVLEMKGAWDEENEEYEYGYDEGIAP